MAWVLLALGLVLMVEGLAYVLAPSLIEQLLEAMRQMPLDMRRLIGVTAIAAGVAMMWMINAM